MCDTDMDGHTSFARATVSLAGSGDVASPAAARRRAEAMQAAVLMAIVDAIDYGLVVLGADARILITNQSARMELGRERFVKAQQDKLALSSVRHAPKLDAALGCIRRGQRSFIALKDADDELALSFVPLNSNARSDAHLPDAPLCLVIFGKQNACEPLTLQQYGRLHGLTGAEQALMPAIIRGLSATAIAQQQRVAVGTVRSQLGSIREKTGTRSLRALMARLTSLPPMRPSLTHSTAH
jgi:DNA-binding NarL/FixJ family response regulator